MLAEPLPSALAMRSEVEVRLTPRAVEIFLKGERIAAHLRRLEETDQSAGRPLVPCL